MLSQLVTSYLKDRMPERIEEIENGEKRTPFIRINAAGSDFGDIDLYDDGDEVTIYFGRFTHSHFSNYDEIPLEEKEHLIAEDVYEVLKATFEDKVEFWGSHQGSGGFQGVDYTSEQQQGFLARILSRRESKTFYRWSGAKRTIKES